MNWLKTAAHYLATYWYTVCTVLAVAALLAAILDDVDAGSHAAIIAMCLSATMISEVAYMRRARPRRLPAFIMGCMALSSAYLWVADEAGAHPTNLLFLQGIGIIFLLSAILAGILALIMLGIRWR